MVDVSEEVAAALAAKRPVVALESTIVAHGLPWPENLEIGRALEAEVRTNGATPATVAVVGGRVRVGLDGTTLERLARGGFVKAGVADLGPLVACGGDGATTVSATTWAAARAGIRLFATGGIGGVHRGEAWDVSSDLGTIAREPVAVVSAGPKAILDLPRTAEVLETLGVLVLGLGTSELPAFYTRQSGVAIEHRVETPAACAEVLRAHFALHPASGVLVANPIPAEHALDAEEIARSIEDGLRNAQALGVRGKALTPHLLSFLARATHGKSLQANRALALHNAAQAARIAAALGG
jgi:pseudouridine-5'-phosphate glycosidase